jgi:GNAT superfamily N-acetyltransferase
VCFVVPSPYRGQGVARALLRGAIAHAAAHGAVALEAYPIDKPGRGHDNFMWNGVRSMFAREGFVEVARRRPERPVMRRLLGTDG